jgi:hypothetical protein
MTTVNEASGKKRREASSFWLRVSTSLKQIPGFRVQARDTEKKDAGPIHRSIADPTVEPEVTEVKLKLRHLVWTDELAIGR